MQLTIDDKQVTAEQGQTLLEVARAHDIPIPTLCYHESLEARGSCRLCLVEIRKPKWPGWKRLVASCVYPAEEGLEVRTATEEIVGIRKTLIDLLLARCPKNPEIVELARAYGIEQTSYAVLDATRQCILCGQCVRVCEDIIGASAIGMYGRGAGKKVGPAYGKAAETCIGCGACAFVCPTRCIQVIDEGLTRRIPRWNVEFELVPCRICGKPVSTRKHIDFVRGRVSAGPEVLETCSDCLRAYYGAKVAAEGHM
ncbi:MAG: (2Fe-2S)-binding protein [Deltaproteobacteria bacterium]|nr:(2Fe-2S)-binding protein [Deltaproteobacteria bacterium]